MVDVRCLFLSACVLAAVVAGCGDDAGQLTPDSGAPVETGVLVGPNGAEVALPAGGSVTIPAGALSNDVLIGVREVTELPPLPAGHVQSGTALAFTPHGLTFAVPVTLRVPYTGNASRVVRLDDLQDRSWEFVDNGVFSGGVITLSATHFSVYLGVRRTTGTITLDGGSGSGGTGGGSSGTGGTGAVGGSAGDSADAAVDADTVATDAGADASSMGSDAGEVAEDAGYDAATDSGDAAVLRDAGVDAAVDGRDAGGNVDAGYDAGACGQGCGVGEVCSAGICECALENWCAIDFGYDAGSPEYHCVDTQTDFSNCGGCSNVCYEGEQCVQGQCAPAACQGNEVRCNGSCTDVNTDPFQCGGCVPESPTIETCYAGENCYCDDYGLATCAIEGPLATCTDTGFDRLNCGQCGNSCADGNECVEGACQPIDCGGRTLCGNECVDSPSCGVVCNVRGGELCSAGSCYQGT